MVEKITIPSFRKDICVGCIKGFRPLPSNDTVMKLQCGNRYLYIPRYMKPSTINEGIDDIEAFFANPKKKIPGIWSHANKTWLFWSMSILAQNLQKHT